MHEESVVIQMFPGRQYKQLAFETTTKTFSEGVLDLEQERQAA